MIKKFINGYEYFECSNCGEQTSEFDEYCQICGHEFNQVVRYNFDQLEEIDNKNLTICQITFKEDLNNFSFTMLKIDTTPDYMKNDERGIRWFNESLRTYYVFKRNLHILRVGQQINLNLDDFDSFHTENHFNIYYNKKEFSQFEIDDLKTYNIN